MDGKCSWAKKLSVPHWPNWSLYSLFNIFLNDLLLTLRLSDLYNFADDNTILTTADNIDHLLQTLKHESELAVKWFTDNQMVVNPDKFQAMILQNSKTSKNYEPAKLELEGHKLKQKIQLNC